MAVLHNQVLLPANYGELFSFWTRFPDAVLFAGGTSFLRYSGALAPAGDRGSGFPKNILSLEKIDELHRITRTERYLEFGAMVKLNEIIALGKIVPSALSRTLKDLASWPVRNLATIGGAICQKFRVVSDVAAPMAALDARYELRTANQSRWISALRYSSVSESLENRELLTRIRIPLELWNYTVCRKFKSCTTDDEYGGVLIFLAKNQKEILSDLRLVFAGETLFRDKNSESFLAGRALPLERKDTQHYGALWETYLAGLGKPGPMLRSKLVNSIISILLGLSD
ncbi:MAG: FAD binding domain-containing protein [Treponema sp.]|jgi:CO/xanthine dehydrogenase FAD-binding subunit|nr:FAD binding domain-containing protein [Treponema sp.]